MPQTFYLVFSCISQCFENTANYFRAKYDGFRSVNKLVETQYKSKNKIFLISCKMILQMYWFNFLQKINNSIRHIDNKNIEVSYTVNGKLFKLVVYNKKGPSPLVKIYDENNEDISEIVYPYLGPNYDWHNTSFTPNFWNKKSLTFQFVVGEKKTFLEHQKIIL